MLFADLIFFRHIKSASKSKSSTASFVVPDDPQDFDILSSSSDQVSNFFPACLFEFFFNSDN